VKVVLAQEYGFCFGVRRVLKLVDQQLASGEKVYSIGEIIHNPTVVAHYQERGVVFVEDPLEAKDGVGVVRAHGLPLSRIEIARGQGISLIDGTCAFVRHITDLITREHERFPDFPIYLLGEPEHPEIIAATADFHDTVEVLDYRVFDPSSFSFPSRAILLSQTTMEEEKFLSIVSMFVREGQEIIVHNTICPSTRRRQRAARELARQVDAVVVLGGKKSSNTRRLYEICQAIKPSYLVERVTDLPIEEIKRYQVIGVTAGASTPDEVIQEAVHFLENL